MNDLEALTRQISAMGWALAILGVLSMGMLGMLVAISYQLGRIVGELSVLINHVQMR